MLRPLREWTSTDLALPLALGLWGWWAVGWWEAGVVLGAVMAWAVGRRGKA